MIADEWGLSREELDAFSLESHRRAVAASDDGRFDDEIVPIDLTNPHTGVVFAVDETPRRDTSLRGAGRAEAGLPPGGQGDGGKLVADLRRRSGRARRERARRRRASGSSRARASSRSASPESTRIGCCTEIRRPATRALARAGLTWDDISVIEVNEAFASVVLQFARDARLEDRWDDINPNGGGISLGHPLGATGARITATLLNELERRQARYGIATMCIGFGQAIACIVERV